jgi:hypothetical protein
MHLKRTIPDINLTIATFLLPLSQFQEEQRDLNYRAFEMRRNFIFVGNMLHLPNIDATRLLIEKIWPLMRKKLDNKQELHIYGSDFPQ